MKLVIHKQFVQHTTNDRLNITTPENTFDKIRDKHEIASNLIWIWMCFDRNEGKHDIEHLKDVTYSIHRMWSQQTSDSSVTKHCDFTLIIAFKCQVHEKKKYTKNLPLINSQPDLTCWLILVLNFFHLVMIANFITIFSLDAWNWLGLLLFFFFFFAFNRTKWSERWYFAFDSQW